MSSKNLGTGSHNSYKQLMGKNVQTDFRITNEKYEGDVHHSLIQAMDYLNDEEIEEIFGVREVNRILGEGYEILGDLEVEDWAITGSYNGGEIAVGQTVSCNGKEFINGTRIPRDIHQAIKFGERVENDPRLDLEITGYYVVRTEYSPSEVERREKELGNDLKLFGFRDISVNIYELDPEETENVWKLYE